MARIRTIKPDYWTDEKIGKLKIEERLLFIGLWNIADDQGVFKASPGYVKGQLFPYDDTLRIDTVKSWLASLIHARLIVPFEYNHEGYLFIRTFEEHQLINRPSKPKFPNELINSLKQNTHGVLSEYSQPEVVGSNGSSKGEESDTRKFDLSNSNLYKKPKIPTLKEVEEAFVFSGGTLEMAAKFYQTNEGTEWFYRGSPITNFKSFVPGYIATWKKNEKPVKAEIKTTALNFINK